MIEYQSERRFQVWRYEVGHSMLLLRSTKGDQHATRVDVLFKPVKRLDLPTAFDGLTVERAGEGRFDLRGDGWSGSVHATTVSVTEDEGEYFDPSPFADGAGI